MGLFERKIMTVFQFFVNYPFKFMKFNLMAMTKRQTGCVGTNRLLLESRTWLLQGPCLTKGEGRRDGVKERSDRPRKRECDWKTVTKTESVRVGEIERKGKGQRREWKHIISGMCRRPTTPFELILPKRSQSPWEDVWTKEREREREMPCFLLSCSYPHSLPSVCPVS